MRVLLLASLLAGCRFAAASTHFEVQFFKLPASGLNHVHQSYQNFISFSSSGEANPGDDDFQAQMNEEQVPEETQEAIFTEIEMVEEMMESNAVFQQQQQQLQDMEMEEMQMQQMEQMRMPDDFLAETAPLEVSVLPTPLDPPPTPLMGRPDYVGGNRLEGFVVPPVVGESPPVQPSCWDVLKGAYNACGKDRCAPTDEGEEAEHDEVSTSDVCTAAFSAAMERMDECRTVMFCPKMLAAIDVMPIVHPHRPQGLRGASPRAEEDDGSDHPHSHGPHYPHSFEDALMHLDDENLCACGGDIDVSRFSRLLFVGCGGRAGVPPALVMAVALLGLFCWLLVYVRVVAFLHVRYAARAIRNGSDRVELSCGRRLCHRLMAVPLTWCLINTIGIIALCLGPFGLLFCLMLSIMVRRRRLARAELVARRQRVLGFRELKELPSTGDVIVQGDVIATPIVTNGNEVVVGVPVVA